MLASRKLKIGILLLALLGLTLLFRQAASYSAEMDLLQPAELAKELADDKAEKPLIMYVGFANLYRAGHIPGAVFHGTAGSPEGLRALKSRAQKLPRKQRIVLYCGCCPWDRCPNIRPAHKAFREMGFEQIRVLHIPADLRTDWVQKGYPIE